MSSKTHVNVTLDFQHLGESEYDLRIPIHQPIKQLLINIIQTLQLNVSQSSPWVIKVPTKHLLLADDDKLIDYKVTDGDRLIVISKGSMRE
ncbi:EsaB/YukD family protein [Pueribacillus sp. YX66]|uniref:EsaB/YukD family protein n=1 Tax=Pueribacillus sp. YX66 TaxID=3229242 RepID=UPI00358CEC03